MSDTIYYILCGVLTIGVLIGISLMSKVKTSAKGNGLSAVCTALAILVTLYKYDVITDVYLWIFMVVGLILGLIGAYRVKMIEMPQVVALLNGFGGAASAIIALITLKEAVNLDIFSLITGGLALAVGMITLTGSLIAAAKLHNLISQKPVIWASHQTIIATSILLALISIIGVVISPISSDIYWVFIIGCLLISGFFGIAFAIRVGGADMPITISLLNSLSGVAGSIAGMAINDPLLVAVGGIVGASGLLLTQIMCRSMNRALADILLGKTSVSSSDEKANESAVMASEVEKEQTATIDSIKLSDAKNVIIVPGYGMALAQAQGLVKRLTDKLEGSGATVKFGIHPVAGRMPGHMNILLAEVDISYDQLYDIDTINPEFDECDLAIVVGANDVINPAANTAEGTPIYGMPILDLEKSKNIIICNYDLKPGYAGVPNPLYSQSNVILLLGDAKESLETLLQKD
ncbi:MAG: NAD(P)(+) transhydrogenase (Re/Si-specific) subunit beta [Clostridiales bacterium]|nr:NAD(P)(+) transhydrogenase (Re/Si-specific) subunit beta [Clostridiales bacterium]